MNMKKIIVYISLLLTAFSFIDSQIAYGQILLGLPYEKIKDTIREPYTPSFVIKELGNSTISVSNYSSRDFKERDSSSILGYVHLNNIKHLILEEQSDCACQSDTIVEHFTGQDGTDSIVKTALSRFQKLTRPLCSITNEFRNGRWHNGYIHDEWIYRDKQYDWLYIINPIDGRGLSEKYLSREYQFLNDWNWDQIESVTIPESINSINWEAFVDCTNLEIVVVYGKPKFAHHRVITEVEPQYLEKLRNKGNRFCRIRAIGDTMPVEFDSRLYDLDKQVAEAENYSTLHINGFNDDSTYVVRECVERFGRRGRYDTIYNVESTFWDICDIIKNSGKVFDIIIEEDCYYPEIYYPAIYGLKNARSISFPSNVKAIRSGYFHNFDNLTDITLNGYVDIYDVDIKKDIIVHVPQKYLRKYKNLYQKKKYQKKECVFVAIEKK